MDRLTHAEVGGPYSNREDAERAIRSGSFDQDPAELSVEEGESDDDSSDPSSREAMRHHAVETDPQTPNRPSGFDPYDSPSTSPSVGPNDPGIEPLDQPHPEQQFPQTTKPAQLPGGGNDDSLPSDPASPEFTDDGADSDPVSGSIDRISALILADNPELPEELARRVARKTVARLVQASPYPEIEDPLAHHNPLHLLYDIYKSLPKGHQKKVRNETSDFGSKVMERARTMVPQKVRDVAQGIPDKVREHVQRNVPQRPGRPSGQPEDSPGRRHRLPEPLPLPKLNTPEPAEPARPPESSLPDLSRFDEPTPARRAAPPPDRRVAPVPPPRPVPFAPPPTPAPASEPGQQSLFDPSEYKPAFPPPPPAPRSAYDDPQPGKPKAQTNHEQLQLPMLMV